MSGPFFSILLPTKNRSIILGDAIRSALSQTFADFELLVSDNDDSSTDTRAVVAGFSDPRVRYHRTAGNLPMHENWEGVFLRATGRYVFVLEDKTRLVTNALEILHQLLEKNPGAVITFPFIISEQDERPPVPVPVMPRRVSSEEILTRIASFDEDVIPILPRGLNSVAPRALLEDLRGRSPTGRLFSYLAPDYSHCYQILSAIDGILTLPNGLVFTPVSLAKKGSFSNGGSVFMKGELGRRWFSELPIREESIIAQVPVRSPWLWPNLLIYDYTVFVRRPGFEPKWDWVRYHGLSGYQVVWATMNGGDLTAERRMILDSMKREGFVFSCRVGLDFARRCGVALWRRLRGNREV